MPLTEQEQLEKELLELELREMDMAGAGVKAPVQAAEKPEPTFMQGVKAGLTAQPGEGVGHFIGSAIPAIGGAALGGPIGAALGETARQAAGAVVNPEETAKKSSLGIGAQVMAAGAGEAAGPAIAKGLGKGISKAGELFSRATDWLSSKFGKSFLKASVKLNAYGHAPEKALKKEGIIATSWDDLIDKAKAIKHDIGRDMDDVLQKADQDTLTNLDDITKPIDDALVEAQKFPTENKSLIKRLNGLKADTNRLLTKGADKGQMLNTYRANAIKKSLYKVTKYAGTDSDDIPLNIVKQDVARNLAKKIEEVTPEMKPLNDRYGDLVALENAATNRAVVAERSDFIDMPVLFGTGIAASGGLAPGVGLALIGKGIKTPLGGTLGVQAAKGISEATKAATPAISKAAEQIAKRIGGGMTAATLQALSPEQVKEAYKAEAIDRAEAAQLLRENHADKFQ